MRAEKYTHKKIKIKKAFSCTKYKMKSLGRKCKNYVNSKSSNTGQ